jgi:hypothetical protein
MIGRLERQEVEPANGEKPRYRMGLRQGVDVDQEIVDAVGEAMRLRLHAGVHHLSVVERGRRVGRRESDAHGRAAAV